MESLKEDAKFSGGQKNIGMGYFIFFFFFFVVKLERRLRRLFYEEFKTCQYPQARVPDTRWCLHLSAHINCVVVERRLIVFILSNA